MAELKSRRGLVIAVAAVAVVLLCAAVAWLVAESSSGGRDLSKLAATAQEQRIQRRIVRLEALLATINRAGRPPAQVRAAAKTKRAARHARALRRARAARRAKARRVRIRRQQAAAAAVGGQSRSGPSNCDGRKDASGCEEG